MTHSIVVYRLDAFSLEGKGGNPAGVVLEGENLTDMQMQSIAKNMGYSETAFLQKSELADYKVRFFTPVVEVPLCGHATIATFSALFKLGKQNGGTITQETKAGVLKINILKGGVIFMEQASPKFFQSLETKQILDSLGLPNEALDRQFPVQIVSTGLRDILIPLKSRKELSKIAPNYEQIKKISQNFDVSGYHVFTKDSPEGFDVSCRNFAPLYDIPEEAATGTSSGALAAYLWKYDSEKNKEIRCIQGVDMGKPSEIFAKIDETDNEIHSVWVGGRAEEICQNKLEDF